MRRILLFVAAALFVGWAAKNGSAVSHLGSSLGLAARHIGDGIGSFFTNLTK